MSKQEASSPSSITMIMDLSVSSKAADNIPELIKTNFPDILDSLKDCVSGGNRFFGFVIIPGDSPTSFSGFSKGIDSIGLLIHDLCRYSEEFGKESQWIVVANKKTKKQIMPMITRETTPK